MSLQLDQDGHLQDYTQWNEQVAHQLALSLEIELSQWHFHILLTLRQFYSEYGHSPSTRPLIKYLQKNISADINNTLLQQKFNTGLVARHLSRLAGIPKPANCL